MERPESVRQQRENEPMVGRSRGSLGASSERGEASETVRESVVCPSCATLLQLDPSVLPSPTPSEQGLGWWFSCGKCNHHWWHAATPPKRQDYERELQELRRLVGEFDLVHYSREEAKPSLRSTTKKTNMASQRWQRRDTKEALSRSDIQRIKESLIKEVRKEIDDYTRKALQKDVRLLDPRNRELLNAPQGADFFPKAPSLWKKMFPTRTIVKATSLKQPQKVIRASDPAADAPEKAPITKGAAVAEDTPNSLDHSTQKPERRYSYRRVPPSELNQIYRPTRRTTTPSVPEAVSRPEDLAERLHAPLPQQTAPLSKPSTEPAHDWLQRAQKRAEAQPRSEHKKLISHHSTRPSSFFEKFSRKEEPLETNPDLPKPTPVDEVVENNAGPLLAQPACTSPQTSFETEKSTEATFSGDQPKDEEETLHPSRRPRLILSKAFSMTRRHLADEERDFVPKSSDVGEETPGAPGEHSAVEAKVVQIPALLAQKPDPSPQEHTKNPSSADVVVPFLPEKPRPSTSFSWGAKPFRFRQKDNHSHHENSAGGKTEEGHANVEFILDGHTSEARTKKRRFLWSRKRSSSSSNSEETEDQFCEPSQEQMRSSPPRRRVLGLKLWSFRNVSSSKSPTVSPEPISGEGELKITVVPRRSRRFRALPFVRRNSVPKETTSEATFSTKVTDDDPPFIGVPNDSKALRFRAIIGAKTKSAPAREEQKILDDSTQKVMSFAKGVKPTRFFPFAFRRLIKGTATNFSVGSDNDDDNVTEVRAQKNQLPERIMASRSHVRRFSLFTFKRRPQPSPQVEPLASTVSPVIPVVNFMAPKPKIPWHWTFRRPVKAMANEDVDGQPLFLEAPQPLFTKVLAPLKKNVSFSLRRRNEKVKDLPPPLTLQKVLDRVDYAWRAQGGVTDVLSKKQARSPCFAIQEEGSKPTVVAMPEEPEWGLWPTISSSTSQKTETKRSWRQSTSKEERSPSRHYAYRQLIFLFLGLLALTSMAVYWTYSHRGQMTYSWKRVNYTETNLPQLSLEHVSYSVQAPETPAQEATLVISGEIFNSNAESQPVGPIGITVFISGSEKPLTSWRYLHKLTRILPFERSKFTIMRSLALPNPPSELRVELAFCGR